MGPTPAYCFCQIKPLLNQATWACRANESDWAAFSLPGAEFTDYTDFIAVFLKIFPI
jgi:hypothetical protein